MTKPMTPEEQKRRQKKTKSLRTLAEDIHKLRNKVTRDLKSDSEKTRLTALVVAIIDKTAERIGNEESAKDGHFGVTGLQNRHITVDGNTIYLKYVGKSGVDHEKQFSDKTIAKLLKQYKKRCDSEKSPLLVTEDGFKIKADRVNRYLKDFEITAKDIRGYSANTLITTMLKNSTTSTDEKERKKKFREFLKTVAEKIGHQQATLKMHYLLPNIESEYVGKGKVLNMKKASNKNIIEDTLRMNGLEAKVSKAIGFFNERHVYNGTAWGGIEKFHFNLASATDSVAIESAGWYKHPSSFRSDMDGKDWHLVISCPEGGNPVVVNCHSLLHDGSWVLTTTTYPTKEIDLEKLSFLQSNDPWTRSMLWTLAVARALESSGYDHTDAINDMLTRIAMALSAWSIYKAWASRIEIAYKRLFPYDGSDLPDKMTIAVNDWNLKEGKIASYKWPNDLPWGTITISPRAFKSRELLESVIKHELSHAVVGHDEQPHHNEKFLLLADVIGISKEYQD